MRWRSAWKLAMHTPNCLRVFMYSTVMATSLVHHAHGFGAGGGNAGVHGQFQRGQAVGGDERGRGVDELHVGGAAPSCVT
jgi:hypothetical protein